MFRFPPADPDGKISRISYVIEAALEYFVTLILSDLFLSALMTEVGMSTALQGLVTSIHMSAGMFQLAGVLLVRRRVGVKRFVTLTCLVSQLSLAAVYFTPLFNDLGANARSILLALLLAFGYSAVAFVNPFRTSWMMSNVPDRKRGGFTAIKEIVSLYSGFAFSFVMGRILDSYRAQNDLRGFFLVAGISTFVISIPHMLSLILVRENSFDAEDGDEKRIGFFANLRRSFCATLGTPSFRRVIPVYVLYAFSTAAASFYGTYKLNVLGYSATFTSLLFLLQSVVRSAVSLPLGKIADKTSWATLLMIVSPIAALGYFFAAGTVPANGMWCFPIYYFFYAISMGGLNSAMFNLTFDYVPHKDRADAVAWISALEGVAILVGTLGESALADRIEANGNRFLGLSIYPQQVFSAFSALCLLLLTAYAALILRKKPLSLSEQPASLPS